MPNWSFDINRFSPLLVLVVAQVLCLSCVQELPTSEPPPVGRPVVTILSPADSAVVVDSTYIVADAVDERSIARVELYIDYRLDSTRILTARPFRWKWDVQSLLDSSYHRIYVRAYDDEGNASNSSLVNLFVRVSSLPPAPSGLDVQSMSTAAVALQWQDNSSFETGFDIMVSTDNGLNYVTMGTAPADATQATITGPFSTTATYLFRVRARAGPNTSALSNGMSVDYATQLYVGGSFTTAGGVPANYIARWDGSAWSAVDAGTNAQVLAFAVFEDELYVGGQFTSAGGVAASNIARWNGRFWSAVGAGTANAVYALKLLTPQVLPDVVFVGGAFITAGGLTANRVATWDGAAWSTVGSGMGDLPLFPQPSTGRGLVGVSVNVFGVITQTQTLIAGGRFGTADGVVVNNIARASGNTWVALGAGTSGVVHGLATFGATVYAGGEFDSAGGVPANHIARWNGSQWAAVGTGVDGTVRVLYLFSGALYAGGDFATAGGASVSHVASLSGSTWLPVAGGTDGPVYALMANGNDLCAGGAFSTAGGVGAANIARWDGAGWSALGGGVNGAVRALAPYGYWSWTAVP